MKYKNIKTSEGKVIIALIKWVSIILLTKISKNIIIKFTIFLYSLGDVVILYNMNISLIFFTLGHLHFLWYFYIHDININRNIITISLVGSFLIILLLKKYNKIYNYNIFFIYTFVLFLYLLIPIYYDNYLGNLLFIISDILIGFKVNFNYLEHIDWPLYYTSLLLLIKYY
jgi:hypothetical protein